MLSLVCSCIRLSYGINHGTKFNVAIWAVIEATTALCVASAPALRPLIFRTSYFSRSTSNKLGGSAASHPMTCGQKCGKTGTASLRPIRESDEMILPKPEGEKILETNVYAEEGINTSSSDSFLDDERPSEAIERE
jgi:hypothetical protein